MGKVIGEAIVKGMAESASESSKVMETAVAGMAQ